MFLSQLLFFISCTNDSPRVSTLPQIHLTCDTDNLNTGDYQVGDLVWFDTLGKRIWNNKIRLRQRGNRSATFEKQSFSLKFNESLSLLGLPKSNKWKLNAEYIDKTFMRNKLSYELFRQFSEGNKAPRIHYCVVHVNDTYEGIYTLTQSVDADFLELDKEKGGVLFKEPPISHPSEEHEERFENFQKYVDRSIRYRDYSIKAKYKLLDECYFNQRYPDIQEHDYTNEIYALTDFIFNSSDGVFADSATFNSFFDIDNLIDWHLLILVTANGDGTYKNFYLSRETAEQPYIFTPWDYDHSFGRDGDGEPSKITLVPVEKNMALLHRLMETNAFGYRQKLYEKYIQLKNRGVLTDINLHGLIDANVAQLKSEISFNEKRWPLGESTYFQNASFQTEVQKMKNWITNHLPELEAYLKEQSERPSPIIEKPKIELPEVFPELLETSAVEILEWLESADDRK